MKKEKSPYSIVAISFVITLSSLLIVVMLVLSATILRKNEKPKEETDLSMSYYTPDSEDAFKILLIYCKEKSEPPVSYTVLEFNPGEATVNLINIPTDTRVTVNTRTDTINGHYDYAGSNNAKIAAGNILLYDIQRYARIDDNGLVNIIDAFGGMERVFSKAYTGEKVSLPVGNHILSGKTVLRLLEEKDSDVFYSFEDFLKKWFEESFKKDIKGKEDYLFTVFVNNADTDITQFDFASHKKALRYFAESGDKKIFVKKITAE